MLLLKLSIFVKSRLILGCIELAWLMGLIEYITKNDRNDSWCGWVDAVTKQPVKDSQIKERYEATILAHTGTLARSIALPS